MLDKKKKSDKLENKGMFKSIKEIENIHGEFDPGSG